MNRLSQQAKEGSAWRSKKLAVLLSASVLISACGGGQDGVSIGSGQDADPVVVDFPIAYIRAPIPMDDDGEFEQRDLREQITFDFGADLFFRDRASPSAEAVNITGEITQGLAAIRDVEIAYDGSALLFAMRMPFDPDLDEEDLPTWNIWEYTFETDELRRVISSDNTAEIGHDIMPKYLPDGRIIFSSTRQTQSQAVLTDEFKGAYVALDEDQNEFAFNLHVMGTDGLNVEQVTYNQSHDLDPSVLSNGQIVFSRWDNAGPQNNAVHLYRMNPDGSALELLYGKQSHGTGTDGEEIQFMQPRELEDGRIMALIRPFSETEQGGELVVIDTPRYLEIAQPTAANAGLTGPAQEDATVNEVSTEPGAPSEGGRYSSVYPILDGTGRLLVSWSQCRLTEQLEDDGDPETLDTQIVPCTPERLANLFDQPDPDNPVTPDVGSFVVAPPLYGIWMYDPRDDTQRPVVPGEEGFMFTEVVSADPKPAPPVVLDGSDTFPLDATLTDAAEGVLNIRSVYDFDGSAIVDIPTVANPDLTLAADRLARFVRIEKAVSIPDEDATGIELDNTDFGVTTAFGMKEIVGYGMVEPDGSVMIKVPANVALMVSVLDANGKRITQRHNNWISVRPGQELGCNGCHVNNALPPISHGRYEAFDSAYAGAPSGVLAFPGTDNIWAIGEVGETMAEIRARVTCQDTVSPCSSIEPSMNVIYSDVWSADPLVAAQNEDINFLYTDLDPILESPATLACQSDWQTLCRTIINYIQHVHPIWSVSRPRVDIDGNPVLDPDTGLQIDDACIMCHTQIDPADGATVIVPAGQLELTDGLSPDEPDHYHAYRELLVADNLQEIVNGALVDALVDSGQVDIDGNPILVTVTIGSPARAGSAGLSGDFFERFEDPAMNPTFDHTDLLSGAERRLIAEWLDIGAQYYNNPSVVPQ